MRYKFAARGSSEEAAISAIEAQFSEFARTQGLEIQADAHLAALHAVIGILGEAEGFDFVVDISGDVPVVGDVVTSSELSIKTFMVDR